jgi:hypothetical protein
MQWNGCIIDNRTLHAVFITTHLILSLVIANLVTTDSIVIYTYNPFVPAAGVKAAFSI